MITGIHALLFTREADEVRAFFRDVLGFSSVDSGGGWLIFALPPAELGIHPTEESPHQELYLMCDDLEATIRDLAVRGVELTRPVSDEGFGLVTAIKIPGGELPLYQPKHPTALPPRS
ncbi:MAG: extradiol dioxygenase [Candidatus Dormibacteraeota bacterium]|nr:extradiol dioxygenase [Candidatus Dormibacteraeota bacterium]